MRGLKFGLDKTLGLIAAAIGLSIASPASAAYTITFQEVGLDVVSTGSGSLNLSAVPFSFLNVGTQPYVTPSGATSFVGSGDVSVYQSALISGPSAFGSGGYHAADTFSGNVVGIQGSNGRLYLPYYYGSGNDLGISTATYSNTSFATLGLTPGSYVYAFGQGASADSFTIQIGDVAASVPEPSTWAMMLLGFCGIGFAMRRRRRVAALQVG